MKPQPPKDYVKQRKFTLILEEHTLLLSEAASLDVLVSKIRPFFAPSFGPD
jgi:hypothetical protein